MVEKEKFEKQKQEADAFSYEFSKYRACLWEIKSRMLLLKERLALGSTEKDKRVNFEIICLQFRSIFELIYLSSLAANQSAYTRGYDKLKEEWSKRSITNFLKSLNFEYYPKPVRIEPDRENKIELLMRPVENGFLTEQVLLEAYNICNAFIHPPNPFADSKDYLETWKLFPDWFNRIHNLIRTHTIHLYQESRMVFAEIDFHKPLGEDDVTLIYLVVEQKIITP